MYNLLVYAIGNSGGVRYFKAYKFQTSYKLESYIITY